MSRWTHSCCEGCWTIRSGDHRTPVKIKEAEVDRCCFCGKVNIDGIYVREDPSKTLCKGVHLEGEVWNSQPKS